MKLSKLQLKAEGSNNKIDLPLRFSDQTEPYILAGITGLDAEDISSPTVGFRTLLGREIGMLLKLNPDHGINLSVSDLRDAIYKIISGGRDSKIKVRFFDTSSVIAEVSGYITKVEASYTVASPEVKVTLVSSEPILKAPIRTEVSVSGLDPALFEIHDAVSTAPHGARFVIKSLVDNQDTFVIKDGVNNSWEFNLALPNGDFDLDDEIHFSSEINNRYLRIEKSASTLYPIGYLTLDSEFPMLYPGTNVFAIENPEDVEIVSIDYYSSFWGV